MPPGRCGHGRGGAPAVVRVLAAERGELRVRAYLRGPAARGKVDAGQLVELEVKHGSTDIGRPARWKQGGAALLAEPARADLEAEADLTVLEEIRPDIELGDP